MPPSNVELQTLTLAQSDHQLGAQPQQFQTGWVGTTLQWNEHKDQHSAKTSCFIIRAQSRQQSTYTRQNFIGTVFSLHDQLWPSCLLADGLINVDWSVKQGSDDTADNASY